jgi:predicted small integral membrane protein
MTFTLEWMAWTWPTAIFFIAIAVMLVGMTLWQVAQPTVERRGFLPLRTTRGDRLFIGLLGSAYILLAWVAFTEQSLWYALGVAIVFMLTIMRFG